MSLKYHWLSPAGKAYQQYWNQPDHAANNLLRYLDFLAKMEPSRQRRFLFVEQEELLVQKL